jgi:hypothetical protein
VMAGLWRRSGWVASSIWIGHVSPRENRSHHARASANVVGWD